MATLLIYTNVNLPFVHFIVCRVLKTMAHRQNQAVLKEPCAGDSFGIDLRDRELEWGDRYRNRILTKECLCFNIVTTFQTAAGSFVLSDCVLSSLSACSGLRHHTPNCY